MAVATSLHVSMVFRDPDGPLPPYAFRFQAVSNPVPDAMQHHTQVGASDPQYITDVLGGEPLDLSQDERQRLPERRHEI